jgi:Protein of unknown function (DUF3748)/WD40-like Beta Propeller Repeat
VWSPCGEWVVFDTRSDAAGSVFDGTRIQAVHIHTGEVRTLYESRNGACCGVATWHPTEMKVAFILGPEFPSEAWSYGASRRQGVVVDWVSPKRERGANHHAEQVARPSLARRANNLDARDLSPPFTPGALRGGSHVHVWHPNGDWLSFTYDDDVVRDPQQRNVAVCFPRPVTVPKTHPRNHDGDHYSVLVTRTVANPRDGTDDISRACEEAWVGNTRTLAFQGIVNVNGKEVPEVFVAELPDDLTQPGDGPLEGTTSTRPAPPNGVTIRRLTVGGIGGPRHWLRSSPDGSRIGFLRPDPADVVQLWTVTPAGESAQVTTGCQSVESCLTWHPDGERVACVMGGRVCLVNATTGAVQHLTEPGDHPPRPEACVVSPDGKRVAFVRRLPHVGEVFNQICIADVP